MRIPLSWLKEYVDVKIPAKELSDKLTMSGTENEILHAESGSFEGIVVGEILEIVKHPNADKLQITKTSVGKETFQIVCGAPNIEVGQKVPVALVGTQIGEFEIKEAELRGVKSYGMLCSEAELGISDDHSGIMILDPRSKVGDSLSDALNLGSDTILEAEVTPNRGDCLSMLGIAGEVSVITGGAVKMPAVKITESKEKASDKISVEIKDKDLCRRYIARVIKNVKIGSSPKWMQDRLSASGVRPINNVVDVTNYVMLEMGQPLHAFDAEKVSGGEITVRRALKGESIKTLDGAMRKLDSNDLVIADDKKTVAIAGVMGGANSEITKDTKTIVLESANFNPTAVRKTALKLSLRSESSARFEKGLSLVLAEQAADRATQLISEVAGGEILAGRVDAGEKKDKEKKVVLKFDQIKLFLGEDILPVKAVSILESLGFKTVSKDKEKAEFIVPSWRLDVSIEEDLLEEIARIYGYENIPSTLPEGVLPVYEKNEKIEASKRIRDVLTALGFFEVYSYSFTSKERANLYRKDANLIAIANPLSQEQEYMRADLLGSLVDVLAKDTKLFGTKIYEISAVYQENQEVQKLSCLIDDVSSDAVMRVGKGVLAAIFEHFNVDDVKYTQNGNSNVAKIITDNKEIGFIAVSTLDRNLTVDGKKSTKVKINAPVEICFFELDIVALNNATKSKKFHTISKFPVSQRDLTFVLNESVRVIDIEMVIKSVESKLRVKSEVVDVYRGKGLPEGKKSISVRFTYQSKERTLTDKEVDDDQDKIIKIIQKSLKGILRDGSVR